MPQRILIVKLSGLADVVRALPVLDYLAQVLPGCEVDWLVAEQYRDVVEGNQLVNHVQVARTDVWTNHPLSAATRREISALKSLLRARQYDLAFDLQGDLRSGLLLSLAGVADRIGFDRDNLQEVTNLLFTTRQVPRRLVDSHVTDQYLRVVSVPFAKDFKNMRLSTDIRTSFDDDAVAEALMAILPDGFVFLFQLGSTWQTRLWHEAGWVELGKKLLESFCDATILLAWGTGEERTSAHSLASLIGPGARVMDRYPLKTFAAILKRVDLVVGPDAGPVHMAAAVGTPTVSFYRASDGRLDGPRGDRHIVVQAAIECSRCGRKTCNRDLSCREKIRANDLFKAVQRLMVPAPLPVRPVE